MAGQVFFVFDSAISFHRSLRMSQKFDNFIFLCLGILFICACDTEVASISHNRENRKPSQPLFKIRGRTFKTLVLFIVFVYR